ncbi:MAG: GMC oxidoreductase, partial [Acidobacteriota bacterium]
CEGWAFDDVLPYFKRGQNQRRGASELHGVGGPLEVMDPAYTNPLTRRFVEAGVELGWTANPDFNGPHQEGIGLYQVNQRRGRRWSAATGYLHPARSRPNLKLLTGARALGLETAGSRVTGVDVLHGAHRRRVVARREVILAAGAVGSPHLMLLSGIGPADELRRHGIDVVLDAPGVGRNLQDHPVVSTVFRSRHDNSLDSAENWRNVVRYLFTRKGPLTSSVCEGGAFARTRPDLPQPDLQVHFIPTALVDHGFDSVADHGFNFGPTLLKPKSRGQITLRSADPMAAPAITANYLDDPEDVRVLVEGVKLARRLAQTRAFADDLDREVWPGPGATTDADLEAFVRRVAATLYHPACTCAMGPAGGPIETAVAPDLKVHGVEGLRVADASVMPELVGGNTNAPTLMIAEKAADLILDDLRA